MPGLASLILPIPAAFSCLEKATFEPPTMIAQIGEQATSCASCPSRKPPLKHEHGATEACILYNYRLGAEDMTHCPFHAGPICSLCCTLDSSCRDSCKPHGRLDAMLVSTIRSTLPQRIADALMSRLSIFLISTAIPASVFGMVLLFIRAHEGAENFDAVLTVILASVLVVIDIIAWTLILATENQKQARDEADRQTQRLLREVRVTNGPMRSARSGAARNIWRG